MINIINILKFSTTNSLILVDELGSGTDPTEGAALAISILEEFYKKGCLTLATTHYPEIKNYALTTNGFENASCEFDIENLVPTYRLLIGVPGKSNAFAISKRLGLPNNILQASKNLLTNDTIEIENLLKSIYDSKNEIEKEKEIISKNLNQIEILRKSLETQVSNNENAEKKLLEKAQNEARNILLNAKEQANAIIKKLNTLASLSNTTNLKEANDLRNQLNTSIKELSSISNPNNNSTSMSIVPKEIFIGMSALFKPLDKVVTILSLPNKSKDVQIQIENIKTTSNIKNLEKIENNTKLNNSKIVTSSNNYTKNISSKSKTISSEINVIGMNVEEAIFIIDKYLDDCYLAKFSPVRIVHGKGTGKLRVGIHNFLKNHSHVKSFRLGTFGEGEMGVTIVEIQ